MPPTSQPLVVALNVVAGGLVTFPSRVTHTRTVEPLGVPGFTRAVPVRTTPLGSVQRTGAGRFTQSPPPAVDVNRAVTWCRAAAWVRTVCIDDSYAVSPALTAAAGSPRTRTTIRTRRIQHSKVSEARLREFLPLAA